MVDSIHLDKMDTDSVSVPSYEDNATNTEVASDLIHDSTATPHQAQEAAESSGAWTSQTYQAYECVFDSSKDRYGIVKSFSTKSAFNSTVGESRLRMGIRDDMVKMTNGRENNYFKATKWSPDGSCLLSSSNDNCLRITALPDLAVNPDDTQLETGMLIREGEVVYDMCWYPQMSRQDPATCCVLSSSRDHPVHLWDAFTGELRCSYTIVDHCEVNVAPTAICFSLDGSKIYCGSNNMVQIFDTSRPGKDNEKHPTVPTRKSKKGQKGVISCLAFNPDYSDLYAAGSYLKTIGLYDARANELLMLLRDKSHRPNKKTGDLGQSTNTQQSASSPMGGLTDLKFSPDGLYLYSASRMDSYIRCWDIRNTANVLYRLERPGEKTNQRISFDISFDGRWLSTGDMNGDVSFFDLANRADSEADRLSARFHAHDDVVSTATFHPSGTLLATSSGQRKYELALDSESESDSDISDSESDLATTDASTSRTVETLPLEDTIDNSIRLWSIPGALAWYVNGLRWSDTDVATGNEPSTGVDNEGASSMDSGLQ
ncbi:telomerase Cajal body protein 1 [Entomortierella parvispora]|uniref:Telomerase Cajal body protein 1 n=1 Tax=Entomortierella parvispora TaxID=205924 RepID=A0A9P3LSG9_9FUNG|nr:telomerase Cajal body protein 1 [Entomortierella parvispora]